MIVAFVLLFKGRHRSSHQTQRDPAPKPAPSPLPSLSPPSSNNVSAAAHLDHLEQRLGADEVEVPQPKVADVEQEDDAPFGVERGVRLGERRVGAVAVEHLHLVRVEARRVVAADEHDQRAPALVVALQEHLAVGDLLGDVGLGDGAGGDVLGAPRGVRREVGGGARGVPAARREPAVLLFWCWCWCWEVLVLRGVRRRYGGQGQEGGRRYIYDCGSAAQDCLSGCAAQAGKRVPLGAGPARARILYSERPAWRFSRPRPLRVSLPPPAHCRRQVPRPLLLLATLTA